MDTLDFILDEINSDINKIHQHTGNNYFRKFMETAYLKTHRLPLPEGPAPYTPCNIESDVQTKGIVWQFLKKLDTLRRPDLHDLKREVMFIDALENVTKKEALIFLHMKDQTLPTLYENITLQELVRVGYFPESVME
jgi:hypothetical protein